MKRGFVTLLYCLILSPLAGARVDISTTKPLVIPEDNVTPKMTKADVAKVIPLDLKRGDSEIKVLNRIADRTVNLWFKSEAMKSTRIVRLAEETQEKLKADVVVPASSKDGVSHKFSFKVEAFQTLAKLEYSGWLQGSVNYDIGAEATNIEIKEKVLKNKNLSISHKANSRQNLSMVGLAWSW